MVEKLKEDMIKAMKEKDKNTLAVIRGVKAAMDKERIDNNREINEELEKNKITFIGNDLLQGMYDQIDNYYQNKKILVDKYNYNKIKNIITDKSTSNNIVLVFDNNSKITTEEYNRLINIDKEKKITIVTTDNSIKISNANIIYYDPTGKTELDQIHLSNKGNNELFSIIKDKIK